MKKSILLLLGATAALGDLRAQPEIVAKFVARTVTFQTTVLPYRLFIPDNYATTRKYPLVLALHGSGERGTDNISQIQNWRLATSWADPRNQVNYPCFVAAPQCPPGRVWPEAQILETLNSLIDSLSREFTLDVNRLYITGLSMGGYGTWSMLSRYPGRFAAAVPMSGGGDPATAAAIGSTPIWNFHGALDDVVPVSESRAMIAALEHIGRTTIYPLCRPGDCTGLPDTSIAMHVSSHADLFYCEYESGGHVIWNESYDNPRLFPWVFDKFRIVPGAITVVNLKYHRVLRGTEQILWGAQGVQDSIEIWFSPDAGLTWKRITRAVPNTGGFLWNTETVSDCAFGLVKIFLRNTEGHIYSYDQSAYFTIDNGMNGKPFVRILNRYSFFGRTIDQDSVGLSLLVGDAEQGAITVRLYYSADGGSSSEYFSGFSGLPDTNARSLTINIGSLRNTDAAVIKVEASDGSSTATDQTVPFVKRTPRISGPVALHMSGSGDGTVTINVVDPGRLTGHRYRVIINDSATASKMYNVMDLATGETVVRDATEMGGKSEGPLFDGIRLIVKDYPQPTVDPGETGWKTGASSVISLAPYLPTIYVGGQEVMGFPYPADYSVRFFDHVVDTSSSLFADFPPMPVAFSVRNMSEQRQSEFAFVDADNNRQLSNFDEIYVLEPDSVGKLRLTWGLTFWGAQVYTLPQPGDEFLLRILKPLNRQDVYEFIGIVSTVGVLQPPGLPFLDQNYPNPFNSSTTLTFQVPSLQSVTADAGRSASMYVTVRVYNVLGQEVSTLVNEYRPPGVYRVQIDGGRLSSGVYFYQLAVGRFRETRKMVLTK